MRQIKTVHFVFSHNYYAYYLLITFCYILAIITSVPLLTPPWYNNVFHEW